MKYRANGIEWKLEELTDGWIAIYRIDGGTEIPHMQAADIGHAKSYCDRYECITVPFNAIDEESQGYGDILVLFGGA